MYVVERNFFLLLLDCFCLALPGSCLVRFTHFLAGLCRTLHCIFRKRAHSNFHTRPHSMQHGLSVLSCSCCPSIIRPKEKANDAVLFKDDIFWEAFDRVTLKNASDVPVFLVLLCQLLEKTRKYSIFGPSEKQLRQEFLFQRCFDKLPHFISLPPVLL